MKGFSRAIISEIFSCWLTAENTADFQTALQLRDTQWLHLKQARIGFITKRHTSIMSGLNKVIIIMV